jgi:hypothetical protein
MVSGRGRQLGRLSRRLGPPNGNRAWHDDRGARPEAAVDLGWEWIDVVFHDEWSEIDRQLWEIDENLMRAELSPTEMAEHLARRKELWAANLPETVKTDSFGHYANRPIIPTHKTRVATSS